VPAQLLRRPAEAAHGDDDAENRGYDTEGRQAIAHGRERARDLFHLGMMRRQIGGHQLLDLMRLLGAETDQAQVVAQKFHRVVVGDEVREAAE
jgi:hypothetical protein